MTPKVPKHKQWFKVVEMEVNSKCNRKCSYCPISILPTLDVPEFMSDEVFKKILNELVRINYSGSISYHLYSEPLLRNDLEYLVRKVRNNLPNVYQILFTNGILLSDKRYLTLKKTGIDHFFVTKHDLKPMPNRDKQTIIYPKDLTLVNRGGTLSKLKKPLIVPCYAPSEIIIITVTGDVLLCCNDAKREYVMGNITVQPIEEIWFSKEISEIRKLLMAGKREEASSICKYCDDKEHSGPGKALNFKLTETAIKKRKKK